MPRPALKRLVLAGLLLATPLAAGTADAACPPLCPAQAVPDAAAAERKARLDALFAGLQRATSQDEADPLVAGIWQTWTRSGRPDIDSRMDDAAGAMHAGVPQLALPILDGIVAAAPDFAEGWNRRATVLYMVGEHERSLADIERVLALEPRHFGALAGRGMIAIAAERWKDALAAYRAALKANPFLRERHEIIPALERKVEGDPT